MSTFDTDENNTKVLFGTRIRSLRQARGLSQESFADAAEIDRSYIGGVERGERNISLVNIKKIADALDISIDQIFKELYD